MTEPRPDGRRAVVSLATAAAPFPARLERLAASVRRSGSNTEIVLWRPGHWPHGCPSHLDTPFAFKPHCLAEAHRAGADIVLWLDSSIVVVRPLDPLYEEIERRGYLLFRNGGARVGEWSSDAFLEWYGIDRGEAMAIPEVVGTAIGLDLRSEVGRSFLDAWMAGALAGTPFRGRPEPFAEREAYEDSRWNRSNAVSADSRVLGHRHDQSVASVLAFRAGMTLTSSGYGSLNRRKREVASDAIIVKDKPGLLDDGGHRSAAHRLLHDPPRIGRRAMAAIRGRRDGGQR